MSGEIAVACVLTVVGSFLAGFILGASWVVKDWEEVPSGELNEKAWKALVEGSVKDG